MPPDPEIQGILEATPSHFRSPGGALAVIKDGKLAGQHVWGYADINRRIPLTPQTIFPICSISKQMVCLVLTELLKGDGGQTFETQLTKALHELLPERLISNEELTVERLVGMQSGLRDYWALTALWGAAPQGRFSIYQDARQALQRLGGFHFPPGTQTSYSNTNFMAVGLATERAAGQTLEKLLESHVFQPAGMKTARLRPDTERLPPPLVGYEGSEEKGYIPYINRIEWAGDAGVQASLEDMIAYEKYINTCCLTDQQSAYGRNAQQIHFLDGTVAKYSQGLVHADVEGVETIGHSGGLAGFRLHRIYAAEHRLSVVVMLNSERDPQEITSHVLKKILNPPPIDEQDSAAKELNVTWTGYYFDEEANLAIAIKQERPGEVVVSYGPRDEKLKLLSGSRASAKGMQLDVEERKLSIHRRTENRTFTARLLAKGEDEVVRNESSRCPGSYRSEEIDSTFHCSGEAGMLFGCFDGYLGAGPVHVMKHVGEDVWLLACHRSLDAPAPGNWTVVFRRGDNGTDIRSVTIGCWLARNIEFVRL